MIKSWAYLLESREIGIAESLSLALITNSFAIRILHFNHDRGTGRSPNAAKRQICRMISLVLELAFEFRCWMRRNEITDFWFFENFCLIFSILRFGFDFDFGNGNWIEFSARSDQCFVFVFSLECHPLSPCKLRNFGLTLIFAFVYFDLLARFLVQQ